MPLENRVTLGITLMIAAAVVHFAVVRYLEAAGPMPTVHLKQPLANLPTSLGEWDGEDLPPAEGAIYGDDYAFRSYRNRRTQQTLTLWVVYSEVGEDRGHHPDVCMKVAGKVEDKAAARTFPVEGHSAPIQQYRFLDADGSMSVFYWHYTMQPPPDPSTSALQRRYQALHKRPSSMTIEVFAPERVAEDAEKAREFVRLIDAELQRFVGPHAVRGSKRIPVMVVDENARPAEQRGH